jgi:hypothetical protein
MAEPTNFEWYHGRSVIGHVVTTLQKHEIPHRKIHAPRGQRLYPSGVVHMLNLGDWGTEFGGVAVEDYEVLPYSFPDLRSWEESLASWDRRFTMFVYIANEYYEPRVGLFPNALEAIAAWMSIDHLRIWYYVSEQTDEEFERTSRQKIEEGKAQRAWL